MKYYFISTNAACYDDFLKYYLNREFLKQMSADNASDSNFSIIHTSWKKEVVTAPYKKYQPATTTGALGYKFWNGWTKSQINGYADNAAILASIVDESKRIKVGFPIDALHDSDNAPGATCRPGWGTIAQWSPGGIYENSDKPIPTTAIKGAAFSVENDEGTTIWSPKGDTALYDKIKAVSTDIKFIFVDFNNVYSDHFDTYWSRVEACNSGWNTATKAANKAQAQTLLGCTSYQTEDLESDGSTTTNTIKNYPLGYPTIAADGSVDDRVHVLEIDKLLDKDSTTMSALASFCGISVSDEAATTIDTFKSDIA